MSLYAIVCGWYYGRRGLSIGARLALGNEVQSRAQNRVVVQGIGIPIEWRRDIGFDAGFSQVQAVRDTEGRGSEEQTRAIRQGDGFEALDGARGGLADDHGAAGGLERGGEDF